MIIIINYFNVRNQNCIIVLSTKYILLLEVVTMSEEIICSITPPQSPNPSEGDKDLSFLEEGAETTESSLKQIVNFRWFSCLGEAKLEKINISEESYIKNNEMFLFENFDTLPHHNYADKKQHDVNLFNETYDVGSMFIYKTKTLFHMARSEILLLQDAAKSNHTDLHTFLDFHSPQDYLKARRHCVKLFLCVREYLIKINVPKYYWILPKIIYNLEENLNGFRFFLGRLTSLPEYVLHHAAYTQGNKCLEASYHLFHCSLDMFWLQLSSLYLIEKCHTRMEESVPASQHVHENMISTNMSLEESTLALIVDLVQLAVSRFEKVDIRSLTLKSPFTCNCVAELWILIQMFTNKLNAQGKLDNFWMFVNKVLEKLIASGGKSSDKSSCMTLAQSITQTCTNVYGFSLWLLKHVAMLNTFDDKSNCSNYPLLEVVVKGLLNSDVPEAQLRIYLTFIEKIAIQYWEPKSEIIIVLWEHFHKRLNSTFYVPGSSIDSLAVVSESAKGMIKQVKSRLSSSSHCDNSFQMFLRILGLHLQNMTGRNQHWNQIRGRIYSKLSASKVQSLTEVGLFHFSSLFLTLAVTADLNEVSKKLQALLTTRQEPESEANVCRLVWRIHLSLCLLYAERCQDFTTVLTPLTNALSIMGTGQDDVTLVRTYLDGIKDILECSSSLKIGYSILIGSWISKFLKKCSPNDETRLLEVLHTLLLRVRKQPSTERSTFESNMWEYLSSYLKVRICEDDSPLLLADVSLSLCLLAESCSPITKEILQMVFNNNTTNIIIVRRFLWQFVQQNDLLEVLNRSSPGSSESHESLIIKGWIHCSLLSLDYKSCELNRVTNYITHLPFIKDICMDLPSSTDPLTHFVVAVSNKYKTAKDIFEKSNLRQRMSRYLTGMDKWIEPYVKQAKSQEIIARIYHIVGLIFRLMPSFIYIKSRPNTVLKGLLDIMFLTVNAYKPNFEPSPHIKAVIVANIQLYISGLAELGVMYDSYIDRCTEDLVKIYLPWVVGQNNCALQECMENDHLAHLVLKTVCSAFIKRKASIPHPHCSQALTFLESIANRYSRENHVMMLLVEWCFEHVCDVIMFCDDFQPCKKIARKVLVSIFESNSFGEVLGEKIMEKFGNLCKDYLPFLPSKLFNLFHEVLHHRPELISRLLPDLQSRIRAVEEKRGITYDRSLREYIEKLDKALKCLRNGA